MNDDVRCNTLVDGVWCDSLPCLGSAVACVVDGVAANGDSCLIWVLLSRTYLAHNMVVHHIPLSIEGYVVEHDRLHCFGACNALGVWFGWMVSYTLAEAPDFVCVGFVPLGFVLWEMLEWRCSNV